MGTSMCANKEARLSIEFEAHTTAFSMFSRQGLCWMEVRSDIRWDTGFGGGFEVVTGCLWVKEVVTGY